MKKIVFVGALTVSFAVFADVAHVSDAVNIDGHLDENCWKTAKWNGDFTLFESRKKSNNGAPRKASVQTSFAIAADAKAIYVGVRCDEPNMAALKALPIASPWTCDGLELFLSPTGGSFDFYQFVVPFDERVGNQSRYYSEGGNISPDPYAPDWSCARAETAEGWTCEIAIPLSAFYMTRNSVWSGTWRINVARYVKTSKGGRTSWSPLFMRYIEPERFRTLNGFPMRRVEDDVKMSDVTATIRERRDNRLMGTLEISAFVAKPGMYELTSAACPTATKVTLKAGENKIEAPCSFAANGRNSTRIELKRLATGETYARSYPVFVDYEEIRLKFTQPQYRSNFYPGQDASRIAGRIRTAVKGDVKLTLEGAGISRISMTPDADGTFSFATPNFAVGEATLTVEVGECRRAYRIRRLSPTGRRMAWIENGRVVVDGKPIFRRGIYAKGYHGGKAFDERFAAAEAAGELVLTPEFSRGGTLEPARVLKGLLGKEARLDVRPSAEYFARIDKKLEEVKDLDFAFWYISDEPECRGISPVYLRHIYEYIKERDPYHIVVTSTRAGKRYIDCADLFETHPYLSVYHNQSGERCYGKSPNEIGRYLDAFDCADRPDKCVGFLPTMFSYRMVRLSDDYPTFREYVCHVWAALLRGARTFNPYAYHDMGDRASIFEGNRYVNETAAELSDFFLDARRTTLLRTSEAECGLWELGNGERLFALVNFTSQPRTISVPGLSGTFSEFRGSRTFVGSAPLDLAPFEVLVGTSVSRGAALAAFDEVQRRVDRAEKERTSRDNQLFEAYDRMEVTHSTSDRLPYKLFDGVRDVYAWAAKKRGPFIEIALTQAPLEFSRVKIWGSGVKSCAVSVRAGADEPWKKIDADFSRDGYAVGLELGRTVKAGQIRFDFIGEKHGLELYEIEIPAAKSDSDATIAKSGARK